MRDWQDCGFRDQREVDLWYGRCPDCGDAKSPRCRCDIPLPEQPSAPDTGDKVDDGIPF